MTNARPLTILCVSSYEKGQEFMRTCKSIGCRVLLLTVEKLRDGDWPREVLDDFFLMPENLSQEHLIYTVSYMARSQPIDRIVALDEFDMENVSALREHLRIPGMGLTTVRYFRDKLSMRARAKEAGIEFVSITPLKSDSPDFLGAQWVPIRPNTDTALMLAMMHTLLTEGRYDTEFVARYCTGFEPFRRYLLGLDDATAKDAQWAEAITGV